MSGANLHVPLLPYRGDAPPPEQGQPSLVEERGTAIAEGTAPGETELGCRNRDMEEDHVDQ